VFFFNDECDLADDDQYDLFTLATEVARRSGPLYSPGSDKNRKCLSPNYWREPLKVQATRLN